MSAASSIWSTTSALERHRVSHHGTAGWRATVDAHPEEGSVARGAGGAAGKADGGRAARRAQGRRGAPGLKPGNVMVSSAKDGEGYHAVITDFGLGA